MSATLQAESFAAINIKERTSLAGATVVGATSINVISTEGYSVGDVIFVGALGREGCERAAVGAVTDADTLTLAAALTLPHKRYDAVTSVVGDRVRIYRAVNVDGTPPADVMFSPLSSRAIDPDQVATYYTDSTGSSSYWYKLTYWNESTNDETSLASSEPVRGADYGSYAPLEAIRSKAGFSGASNLTDQRIEIERKAAQEEINSTLKGYYTVPFTSPVPDYITSLTIQLAAGLLLQSVYGSSDERGKDLVGDARAQLEELRSKTSLTDATGTGSGVISSWPDETTEEKRAFEGVWDNY